MIEKKDWNVLVHLYLNFFVKILHCLSQLLRIWNMKPYGNYFSLHSKEGTVIYWRSSEIIGSIKTTKKIVYYVVA